MNKTYVFLKGNPTSFNPGKNGSTVILKQNSIHQN